MLVPETKPCHTTQAQSRPNLETPANIRYLSLGFYISYFPPTFFKKTCQSLVNPQQVVPKACYYACSLNTDILGYSDASPSAEDPTPIRSTARPMTDTTPLVESKKFRKTPIRTSYCKSARKDSILGPPP